MNKLELDKPLFPEFFVVIMGVAKCQLS